MHRRQALTILAVAAAAVARPAGAQSYPSRPVRVVVPFPPGGTIDHTTRLLGAELAKLWGQNVIVENRPGAATIIGVDSVVKAAADGHTLAVVTGTFTVNHSLMPNLPYDSRKDLRPIVHIARTDHVLVVHPAVAASDLQQFIALVKANPGKYTFASFGNGSSAHLAGENLNLLAGLDLTHVPYKGQAPALADVMGGQVHAIFANLPETLPQIRAGKVKALGMAAPQRSTHAPDIATLAEQGLPGLESSSWSGLMAPAATPTDVAAKVNADANRALKQPALQEAFAKSGITAIGGTPTEFERFLIEEMERQAAVIRKAGIKPS
ncbi:MAG TPA: tripartite tricarboxylate transporter substrate binding protein [Burkholderiaceae bacterium]|nr:tripartite tricarboxylate transporter substrate binding protein [Burkholderiaceae bacterium]